MARPDRCGEYLMEADWEEGFECSLFAGHLGAHRCEGGIRDYNESTDREGRRYTWVHEWRYVNASGP